MRVVVGDSACNAIAFFGGVELRAGKSLETTASGSGRPLDNEGTLMHSVVGRLIVRMIDNVSDVFWGVFRLQ
jgi:hypothetical protein